jgi:hypothetical protein
MRSSERWKGPVARGSSATSATSPILAVCRKSSASSMRSADNAAINPSRNDILHTDSRDWMEPLKVNLGGAFNCLPMP